MYKLMWVMAAVAVGCVVTYWGFATHEDVPMKSPTASKPVACGKCDVTTCEAPMELVEVIDLSPVYESRPSEDEPPLAEFDPPKEVGEFAVPAAFPLTRELAAFEKMPLIGSEEESEAAVLEVLPMPKECATTCETDCCSGCVFTFLRNMVKVKVEMCPKECAQCPATGECRRGSVKVSVGVRTGEEEQSTVVPELLPMPKQLADPSKLTPTKRTKIDTMEVRPTDVPGLSAYPFPY